MFYVSLHEYCLIVLVIVMLKVYAIMWMNVITFTFALLLDMAYAR